MQVVEDNISFTNLGQSFSKFKFTIYTFFIRTIS